MKKLLLAAVAALTATAALAEYPEKPITIVVPFAAGGPTDKVARDLAEALRKPLGATLLIENVGGVGGTLGANKVAKAAPDGYTLLLHHIGMASAPALYRSLPYKAVDDFEYLGLVNEVPMTLIGRPDLPANNYAELIKWLTANKGKVNFASYSAGTVSHTLGLELNNIAGLDMVHVPYKGSPPALQDLMGGQVQAMFDASSNVQPFAKAGKLKVLATTAPQRLPTFPDVPTFAELGHKDLTEVAWAGLWSASDVPAPISYSLASRHSRSTGNSLV